MRLRSSLIVAVMVVAAGCNDNITDPNPPVITLSAQQAGAIAASAEAFAQVHPDLEWLTDSIEVVVRAGAQAKRIVVTSQGVEIAYYAVGLQREVIAATSSFSTWHLIAFDNPSNPTEFVLANGFASSSTTTPPTSADGGFGGDDVFAHFIRVDDGVITDWRAITGGATFMTATSGGECPVTGTPPEGVTCALGEIEVSFDIVFTTVPAGNESRTANLLATRVPGAVLRFEPVD
ncbi:MAG: hypothetical protein ACREOK_09390 [Gemmatimonadaceae bacterium]